MRSETGIIVNINDELINSGNRWECHQPVSTRGRLLLLDDTLGTRKTPNDLGSLEP